MIEVGKRLRSPALWVMVGSVLAAVVVARSVGPTWTVDQRALQVEIGDAGQEVVLVGQEWLPLEQATPAAESQLQVEKLAELHTKGSVPDVTEQFVYETLHGENLPGEKRYFQLTASRHWGVWSFLPALTAILLCWMTKEPISSLLAGIVVGALLVAQYDVVQQVLIPSIGTVRAAGILILYLWLLGGLLGVWAKTGASLAFAEYVSTHWVSGPRSAKLAAWVLGVLFFQGGTISAVLVGTTVKPLADKQRVSHEELSLIVDSTASPVAVLLALNAWPAFVQGFLGVAGVAYLATEQDRISFFFKCIPLNFYAIFIVLLAFLLSIEKLPWMSAKLRTARQRARDTGQLDAPGSEPLASNELAQVPMPVGYTPDVWEFLLPLVALLGVAVGSYLVLDSPNVVWAFTAALLLGAGIAWIKGMKLTTIVSGAIEGQKSLVLGSVILLLAITIGDLSQQVGGGRYLVALQGDFQWYWLLPATVFGMAVVISFSTGSSWATFAVTLPLVMPLAAAVGISQGLAHPDLFLAICFAACLNGGVFGDQCSPISDTTILSAMCTGGDLMDHVTTQLPLALQAAVLAVVGWTAIALACA